MLAGTVLTGIGIASIPYASADMSMLIFWSFCAAFAIGNGIYSPTQSSLLTFASKEGGHELGTIMGAQEGLGALARIIGPLISSDLVRNCRGSGYGPTILASSIRTLLWWLTIATRSKDLRRRKKPREAHGLAIPESWHRGVPERGRKACERREGGSQAAGILDSGGSAIEAAVEACVVLEDDPVFNAGTGSVFRTDGSVHLDASIQTSEGKMGFVIAMQDTPNPIRVAADLLDEDINGLSGDGARLWADSRVSKSNVQGRPPSRSHRHHRSRSQGQIWTNRLCHEHGRQQQTAGQSR